MNLRSSIACALFGATLFAGTVRAHETPAPAAPVPTQASTVVLMLDQALSSKTARTGEHFALHADEDVLIDGAVIVPKGAIASGTVLFARRKGSGRSGALDLRVDYVDTPAGRLRLRAIQNRRSDYVGNKAVVVGALFGILGRMAVQGDEIEVGAGLQFEAELVTAAPAAAVAETATPATPAPATSPESAPAPGSAAVSAPLTTSEIQ